MDALQGRGERLLLVAQAHLERLVFLNRFFVASARASAEAGKGRRGVASFWRRGLWRHRDFSAVSHPNLDRGAKLFYGVFTP